MKIVKQTSTVLELQAEEGTYLLTKMGLLFMTVVMGIVTIPITLITISALLSQTRAVNLSCYPAQSAQVSCRITKSRLLRKETQEIEAVTGTEFALESIRTGKSRPETWDRHTLMLLTDQGKISSGIYRTFRERAKAETHQSSDLYIFRDKLEDGLSDPSILPLEKDFKYGESGSDFLFVSVFIMSLVVLTLASLLIWARLPVRVILDKRKDHFCVSYHNALSLRHQVQGNLSKVEQGVVSYPGRKVLLGLEAEGIMIQSAD